MLTLVSSILGFLTSGVPKVLEYFQDRKDKQHELNVMKLQTEREIELAKSGAMIQREIAEIEMDRSVTDAQIREAESIYAFSRSMSDGASQWIVNLRASVQPCVTYGLFMLLVMVEAFGMWFAIHKGIEFDIALNRLWSDHAPLWGTIVAFWFGGRQFNTKRK